MELLIDMNGISEEDAQKTTQQNIDEDFFEEEVTEEGIGVGVSSIMGTRKNQQDTVFGTYEEDVGIGIVCDGMGGLSGGERASALAAEALASAYFSAMPIDNYDQFFRNEAVRIDRMVAELTDETGRKLGGGTTMVAATIRDGKLYYLSVGDSKIYLIRKNNIQTLNRLHNYRMTMDAKLSEGKITLSEYKSQEKQAESLISYIGMGNVSLMDTNPEGDPLENMDIILLCSDGLYKILSDEEILNILMRNTFDMKKAANELTEASVKRRKRKQDNTSVVLLQYRHNEIAHKKEE